MQQISIQHNHVKYYSEKHKPQRHLRDNHLFVGEEIGLREVNCLTQATQQISSRPSSRTQPPDLWRMQHITRLPGSSRGPPLFTCPNFPSLARVQSPCWPNNIILVLDILLNHPHGVEWVPSWAKSFSLAIIHFFEWFLSSLPSFQCWSLIFTFFLFEVTFTNLTIFVPSPVIVHWQVTRSLLTLLNISAVIYIPLAWIYCPVLHPFLTPDPSIPLKVNCDFLILPATWDFPLSQALFSPSWWTKTPPGITRPRSNTLGTHFKSNSEHKSARGSEELSRWFPTPLRKRIWFLLAPQNYSQNNVRGDPE